jgi:hypothetical protein
MEKLWEKLEASVLVLECIWRIKECENSYAVERAYDILEEFLKSGSEERVEEVRKLAERVDEALKECECEEE